MREKEPLVTWLAMSLFFTSVKKNCVARHKAKTITEEQGLSTM
jgi:hypothetical protein